MAVPSQITGLVAQQSDGNILLTWSVESTSTSYQIQRSTDGINFTNLATVTATATPQYVDSFPGVGIAYWYQIAGINISGTGAYSSSIYMIASPPGEMSLYELRNRSKQTADRVNSKFVTDEEWNEMIRLSLYELYDIQITAYEDFNIAPPVFINTNGTTFQYDLPDGTNYKGAVLGGSSGSPAPAFYKLAGVDLGVNTSNNAWVTVNSFNWIDRNNYVYPNSTSTIYGVYNMRYRMIGRKLNFIPIPAGNQQVRLWYAPVLPSLLSDTDLTTIGYTGWLRYVIVRAAIYALNKEESDTTKLEQELVFMKTRIEQATQNRDQGQADTISNTRKDSMFHPGFGGVNGSNAGW